MVVCSWKDLVYSPVLNGQAAQWLPEVVGPCAGLAAMEWALQKFCIYLCWLQLSQWGGISLTTTACATPCGLPRRWPAPRWKSNAAVQGRGCAYFKSTEMFNGCNGEFPNSLSIKVLHPLLPKKTHPHSRPYSKYVSIHHNRAENGVRTPLVVGKRCPPPRSQVRATRPPPSCSFDLHDFRKAPLPSSHSKLAVAVCPASIFSPGRQPGPGPGSSTFIIWGPVALNPHPKKVSGYLVYKNSYHLLSHIVSQKEQPSVCRKSRA